MTSAYIVTGTLTDAKTVQLDEALPVTAGKVRVIVETSAGASKPNFRQVLEGIWAEQAARGQVPPTVEDVEARIREERDWGGR